MTEEQIKQRAEKYAESYISKTMAYIGGAHSRDEEVEMLQNQIEELSEQLKMNAENIQKLRNPWISVDERLPKKDGEYVLVYIPKHNEVFQAFLCDNEWIGAPTGEEVTHWMPIPKLKKGE